MYSSTILKFKFLKEQYLGLMKEQHTLSVNNSKFEMYINNHSP